MCADPTEISTFFGGCGYEVDVLAYLNYQSLSPPLGYETGNSAHQSTAKSQLKKHLLDHGK